MNAQEGFRVERILVALDAGSDPAVMLEAAGEMASRLRAELLGIFVEDENLLHSATLPFVKAIGATSAATWAFDSDTLEVQLRRLAARARRLLEREARQRRVDWSFTVHRGAVSDIASGVLDQIDMLVLDAPKSHLVRHCRLTLLPLLDEALRREPRSVLVCGPARGGHTVRIVLDARDLNRDRVAEAGLDLASMGSRDADVIVVAESLEEAHRIEESAKLSARARSIPARILSVNHVTLDALLDGAGDRVALLVLSAGSPLRDQLDVATTRCAVLLVR